MSREKSVPLTFHFEQDPSSIIGAVDLVPEKLSDRADDIWKLFYERPELFTFEPGYVKHEDGTVELLEISMVMKPHALVNNGASMALDDLIADLD